jgi:tetratricopeptide (TPR) repeat protein
MTTDDISREGTREMQEGLSRLAAGTPESLAAAIPHFDRAIALRQQLIASGQTGWAFGVAAGWLNRGECLLRIGDAASLAAALPAFDEGIRLLLLLGWTTETKVRRRLAIAWQNRGLVLQAIGNQFEESRRSFAQAIQLLEDEPAAAIDDRAIMLATVWTNLASACAERSDQEALERAVDAAQEALRHIDPSAATEDLRLAEPAVKARHALCRALASRLSAASTGEALHAATDAVDEGLALARQWEQKGVDRFRDLATDLLRFGSRVYAKHQPQFLDEFLVENLDATLSSPSFTESADIRAVRLEALWLMFSRPRNPS